MIRKRLSYLKKYKYDVWNLRLLSPYKLFPIEHRTPYKSCAKRRRSWTVKYKYFFLFFFKVYKKRREMGRRRRRPFVYMIEKVQKRVKQKKIDWRYASLRLVKYYYVFLTYKKFKKLGRRAKKKDGLFEQNYLILLEGRLVNFLYRTGLVDTLFNSYYYIKSGYVTIDWKVCSSIERVLYMFDLLSFLPQIFHEILVNYFYRIHRRLVLHHPVRYLYVSFYFLFTYMFKYPAKRDIPNRKLISMYRLTGYPILF